MPKLDEIDIYAGIESPLSRWDPRVKLTSILLLIFSIVLLDDLIPAALGLILSFLIILISRIPLNFVLERMRWVFLFVLFIFIVLSITASRGVEKGALVALRAFSAILLALAMLSTTRFEQVLKTMEKLRVPNKLIQTVLFTYRYIFLLADESHRMFTSLKARGFRGRTDMRTMITIGNSIAMLFVRSYERAQRVYEAMISRGYSGVVNSLAEFEIKNVDYVKGIIVIIFAVSLHVI